MTYRRDRGQTHLLGVVAEQSDEWLQCAPILDPSQCPRRIRADVDRSVAKGADQRINSILRFDETEAKCGNRAQTGIARSQSRDQLTADSLRFLSSNKSNGKLAHARIFGGETGEQLLDVRRRQRRRFEIVGSRRSCER